MTDEERQRLRENLVRPADIAERVFVSRPCVSQWIQRYPGFPDPLISTDDSRKFGIYWWPDVQAWLLAKDFPKMSRTSARKSREGRMIRVLGWPGFDLD